MTSTHELTNVTASRCQYNTTELKLQQSVGAPHIEKIDTQQGPLLFLMSDCICKNIPREFDLSLIVFIQFPPRASSPQGLS